MIARASGFLAWCIVAALATRMFPRGAVPAATFAVGVAAALAHALDLWRFISDGLDPLDGDDDGAAGGSAP